MAAEMSAQELTRLAERLLRQTSRIARAAIKQAIVEGVGDIDLTTWAKAVNAFVASVAAQLMVRHLLVIVSPEDETGGVHVHVMTRGHGECPHELVNMAARALNGDVDVDASEPN